MVWKVYRFALLEGKVILERVNLQRGNENNQRSKKEQYLGDVE